MASASHGNLTVGVHIDQSVRVNVVDISVLALLKISGAVAVGVFWPLILMKWFG